MPTGRYNVCPFVQSCWWVRRGYQHLLCVENMISPCITLGRYCMLGYVPVDIVCLVVLKFPDVLGQLSYLSATSHMELVGVKIKARFEQILGQSVVVRARFMLDWDCGSVHKAFGDAVPIKGSFVRLLAVACVWGFVWDWSKDFGVVFADDSCHVAHTAIANFLIVLNNLWYRWWWGTCLFGSTLEMIGSISYNVYVE